MEALLWDMDGLLVDTEPLWTVAQEELAASLGRTFTPQVKAAVLGTRLDVAVPLMLQGMGVTASDRAVAEASERLLSRMLRLFAEPLPLRPGAGALLSAAAAAGIPQALVSSSFRVLVDAVLATGAGPFAVTLAGDEVQRGKPDPEPYLTAADRLGVAPSACVVLEDSAAGVASGLAAGCRVVAVPSLPFVAPSSVVVRASLTDVDVDGLRALVARGGHRPTVGAEVRSAVPAVVVDRVPGGGA